MTDMLRGLARRARERRRAHRPFTGGRGMTRMKHNRYNEDQAYPCAWKGGPHTQKEWEREVRRPRAALSDAGG